MSVVVMGADATFSPSTITGNLLWLKGDGVNYQDSARTVIAAADGDPLGSITDHSPRICHAVQATAGARPTLKPGVLNGKPVLRFNTTDTDETVEAPVVHTGNELTILMVVIARGTPGANAALAVAKKGSGLNDYDTASTGVFGFRPDDTALSAYRNNAQLSTAGAWPAIGTALIHVSHFDGARHTSYLNGTAGAVVASVGAFDFTSLLFGKRFYSGIIQPPAFEVDYAEVLVYDSALSVQNLNRLHAYLNDRWRVY